MSHILIAYASHYGQTRKIATRLAERLRHPWLDGVAVLLVTLGLGAVWEIAEYGVDQVFGRATQGAPNMNALDDTMLDLLMASAV